MRAFFPFLALVASTLLAVDSRVQSKGPTRSGAQKDPSKQDADGVRDGNVQNTVNFNIIHLAGTGKLTIRQASTCGVAVNLPKKGFGTPQFVVKGNTLHIEGGGGIPRIAIPALPGLPAGPGGPKIDLPAIVPMGDDGNAVEYVIHVKDLHGIIVSGTGTSTASGIQGKNLFIKIPGTGSLIATGSAQSLQLSLGGLGSFDGRKLVVRKAQVSHGGTGRSIVYARDQLDVQITGVGSLEYLGSPALTKSVLGIGRVSRFKE